jgi:hypothetical protein
MRPRERHQILENRRCKNCDRHIEKNRLITAEYCKECGKVAGCRTASTQRIPLLKEIRERVKKSGIV